MEQKTLRDVLNPVPEDAGALRWQVTVPLATNPFLLLELFQFAFIGAAVVLVTLCVGVRFTDGVLTVSDITACLKVSVMVFLAIMAGFMAISAFLGNRYFALYQMDSGGIYHEGSKGRDERRGVFMGLRPAPVCGAVAAARTRSRYLPWEKTDRFQDIPSMRVIILRRGFWHMLRLYTPDKATHEQVSRYLAQRLKKN